MVSAQIDLTDHESSVVNIVKAKYGFRNRNDAIRHIIQQFEAEFLEPELRPEFVKRMNRRANEPAIRVKDLKGHH
jgi:hypothetical protein